MEFNLTISVAIPDKGWYWVTGSYPLTIDGQLYSSAGEIQDKSFGSNDGDVQISVNIPNDGFRREVQKDLGPIPVTIRFWSWDGSGYREVLSRVHGNIGVAGIENDVWTFELENNLTEPERIFWSHEDQQRRFPEGDLFFQNVATLSEAELDWPRENATGDVTPRDVAMNYSPRTFESPPPTGPVRHAPLTTVDPPVGPVPLKRSAPRVVGEGIEDQIGSASILLTKHFSNAESYDVISDTPEVSKEIARNRLIVGFN